MAKDKLNHTPAPWKVNKNGLVYFDNGDDSACICVFNGLSKLSPAWLRDPEEVAANGELIAAAPETLRERDQLKEMLMPIIEWGQSEGFENGLKIGDSITGEVLKRAKVHTELVESLDKLLIELSPSFNFDFSRAPEIVKNAKILVEKIKTPEP